jgi:transcriptional regulator with XRE-family HTH domain
MNRFGYEVGEARKKGGLTLEKIARRAGTVKGYISGVITGAVRPPSPKVIRKLAPILGIPEDRLLALSVIAKLPKRLPLSSLLGVCTEIVTEQAREDAASQAIADAHSVQSLKREAV